MSCQPAFYRETTKFYRFTNYGRSDNAERLPWKPSEITFTRDSSLFQMLDL